MWAMLSRCADNGVDSIGMRVQLFGALVSPILNYCSEVWGPALLSSSRGAGGRERMLRNQQHALLFDFLRMIGGGLRKSVCRVLLLREFGLKPLAHQWFMAAVSLWNRVARRSASHPDDWLVLAVKENVQMCRSDAVATQVRGSLWWHQLCKMLQLVNGADPSGFAPGFMSFAGEGVWPCIDEGKAGAAFDAYFFSQLARPDLSPRSAASGQVMCCTYENWFATRPFAELDMSLPAAWRSEALEVGGLCKAHLFNLLRFRLGAHSLRVAEGRWERLPRDRRLCERCTEGVVEDEFHLVFECPAYDSVRANYAQLFEDFSAASSTGRDMAGFMNQNVQQVASFIHTCLIV